MTVTTKSLPADVLLHPISLGCLVLLVFNDHYLKQHHPGWLSGKLSDVAFMVLAPLWLYAVVSMVHRAGRGPGVEPGKAADCRVLLGCVLSVGAFFASMQLLEAGDAAFRYTLGFLQWPFRAVAAGLKSGQLVGPLPVAATPDPTDLICLPVLYLTWRIGRPGEAIR